MSDVMKMAISGEVADYVYVLMQPQWVQCELNGDDDDIVVVVVLVLVLMVVSEALATTRTHTT